MVETLEVTNYQRIKIGKSKTKKKELILKSKINLSNKFITDPFGSNRTRYQYPEMFEYKLDKLDVNDINNISNNINNSNNSDQDNSTFYYYKLTITRKDKINCPQTGNYFWTEGWTNNLSITNVPEISNDNQNNKYSLGNIDYVKSLLPSNYGKVVINDKVNELLNNTNNSDIVVGIIIPCYGRLEYVKKCLESLNSCLCNNSCSKNYSCIVVIMDESTANNNPQSINKDKIETTRFIEQFKCNFSCIKVFKNIHGNMFDLD